MPDSLTYFFLINLTVDKKYMKREVGVLENLYTCLREAASAKAGRHLLTFCYSVFKHITKATSGDIVCYP
jgi:hypothetical protein